MHAAAYFLITASETRLKEAELQAEMFEESCNEMNISSLQTHLKKHQSNHHCHPSIFCPFPPECLSQSMLASHKKNILRLHRTFSHMCNSICLEREASQNYGTRKSNTLPCDPSHLVESRIHKRIWMHLQGKLHPPIASFGAT